MNIKNFNIHIFFERYWLFLPSLSAILLILSFYPFDFWRLGFVALVPLFYFVNFSNTISFYKIFWAGFFVGAVFSAILSFFTVIQFHWLPETYLFVWLARFSFIPITVIGGLSAGIAVLLYRKLRLNSFIDIFIGAALWVSVEWLNYNIFGGFHFGLLAYILHKTSFITLASAGGKFLLSFFVVLINIIIASILLWSRYGILYPNIYEKGRLKRPSANSLIIFFLSTKNIIFIFMSVILFFLVLYKTNELLLYNNPKNRDSTSSSFAIIQLQEKKSEPFGNFQNKEFKFKKLENALKLANNLNPDFIIYPFSPFDGLLSEKEESSILNHKAAVGDFDDFGKWVKNNINPNSIFITWNNVLRDGKIYNEYNFWKDGKQINYYQKRALFPFMDYTPDFSKKAGLYSTPFDVSPGIINQEVNLNGVKISGLLCSELNKQNLARIDSEWANIFLAIGSEAIFYGDIAGNFHTIIAQFTAVENNRPIVRANRFGPSSIIDNKGKILAKMDYGEEGILFEEIKYEKNQKKSLYGYVGDWGFMIIIFTFLTTMSIIKVKFRKLKNARE